jgi:hypothetical protein
MLRPRLAATFALAFALAAAPVVEAADRPALSPEERRALESIRSQSLKGHVGFLAADRLGGRPTPSPEGDIAAEYVAAQFRRAGLEPAGDDGYFQTLPGVRVTLRQDGYAFSIMSGEAAVEVPPSAFRMSRPRAVTLEGAPLVWVSVDAVSDAVPPGSAVLLDVGGLSRGDRLEAFRRLQAAVARLSPALVVIAAAIPVGPAFGRPALVEPPSSLDLGAPAVAIADPATAAAAIAAARRGGARITLRLAEPHREPVVLRNVAGLLRGSDPAWRDSYVLLTAHYDGTGPRPGAAGADEVWNAANDDASGTAVVMEVAAALSSLPRPPRRSLLFVAFAGEETGLRGSVGYVGRPLVPLEKTVAALNLEQLGRTDGAEGVKSGWASVTGWDYSTLPSVLERAGTLTGVRVEKDARRSDAFFPRSDNWPLARAGVVSHTLSVLFDDFTDAHSPADEWTRLDYENLAALARTAGAGLLLLAGGDPPRWRDDVAAAGPYREAAERRAAP